MNNEQVCVYNVSQGGKERGCLWSSIIFTEQYGMDQYDGPKNQGSCNSKIDCPHFTSDTFPSSRPFNRKVL